MGKSEGLLASQNCPRLFPLEGQLNGNKRGPVIRLPPTLSRSWAPRWAWHLKDSESPTRSRSGRSATELIAERKHQSPEFKLVRKATRRNIRSFYYVLFDTDDVSCSIKSCISPAAGSSWSTPGFLRLSLLSLSPSTHPPHQTALP